MLLLNHNDTICTCHTRVRVVALHRFVGAVCVFAKNTIGPPPWIHIFFGGLRQNNHGMQKLYFVLIDF